MASISKSVAIEVNLTGKVVSRNHTVFMVLSSKLVKSNCVPMVKSESSVKVAIIVVKVAMKS